jgi:hypothetical protein
MATGVFSLRKVYIRQYQNVDNRNFASWPESATYGYFGGGVGPINHCTITRLDFSNNVMSSPGKNLPATNWDFSATSSAFYGYFGGGAGALITIQRIDFSTENISLPGKNLTGGTRIGTSAVSSSSYGYFGGGYRSPVTYLSSVARLDFSSETISVPTSNLTTTLAYGASVFNNYYGYFGGGYSPTAIRSTIHRIDLTTETIGAPGKDLSLATRDLAGVSNVSYGYFAGGLVTPSTATLNLVRLDFSNETTSSPTSPLPSARYQLTGTSSASYGYFNGGTRIPLSYLSSTERIDFSSETIGTVVSGNPFYGGGGFGRQSSLSGGQSIDRGFKTYGYITGGANPPAVGTVSLAVNKHDLSTTTVTSLPPGNALPTLGPSPAGLGRSRHFGFSTNYFGYFSGGFQPGGVPGVSNRVSRLDFSNDTWNDPGKNLPVTRYNHTGVSAPQNYNRGYFATGETFTSPSPGPSYLTTVTRIEYSSETVSDPGINLPMRSVGTSGVKTNSYGYFAGGITPVNLPVPTQSQVFSHIARLDFSNESVTVPVNLPAPRHSMFSFHNMSYGYFCGGTGPNPVPPTPTSHCRIERLDFSNETISSRTNMPTAFPASTSISSQFFGFTYGSVNVTQIHRFDFSSETFAPYTSTPLGIASSAAVTNGI